MYGEEEFLALSGLQHFSFCRRQWALIHLEGQWAENYDTIHGQIFHERAHLEGYSATKNVRAERSYRLTSFELGIAGIADVVEFIGDGKQAVSDHRNVTQIRPVEYKVGKAKAEDWDRLQVCAQALCLEEMFGCDIKEGALFYGKTRHREVVILDIGLRNEVVRLIREMHNVYESGHTPLPSTGSRCRRCSLKDICLPEAFGDKVGDYYAHEGIMLKEGMS